MSDKESGNEHRWIHERFRGKIEHENKLVVERVSWLLTSESFLFVAYVILLDINPLHAGPSAQARRLFYLIPGLALFCVLSASVSIGAALYALERARIDFEDYEREHPHGGYPLAINTSFWTRWLGKFAAVAIPIALTITWVILLIAGRY
jgi:hypothetical protein